MCENENYKLKVGKQEFEAVIWKEGHDYAEVSIYNVYGIKVDNYKVKNKQDYSKELVEELAYQKLTDNKPTIKPKDVYEPIQMREPQQPLKMLCFKVKE